jgi:transposase
VAKKLQQRVADLSATMPTAVEVWAQDEARFGLKPTVRKVWAPCGQRPRAPSQTRYEWLYVYGFVRPTTGHTYWLLLPTVNTAAMNVALVEFARDVGAGPDKRILLVLDHAGGHGSTALEVPAGLELVYLPPSTPELQPAEHLWPLLREVVANRTFASLDPLEDTLVVRCLQLADQRDLVQHTTNFHWLPAA